MALQDIIKEMNENKGVEKTPETSQTTPTETNQPSNTQQPEPPVKTETETKNENQPAAQQAQQIQKSAASNEVQPKTEQAQPATDEVFVSRLSELTGGTIKTVDDVGRVMNHYKQLVQQAEKGFEPKFRDERAKLVYQLLDQNAGNEPEAAMRVLRALNFKRDGKSDKDVLFEAYLLDPKNSDLTPLKAQEYFDIEYDQKYRDLEENPLRKRQLELEVREALGSIEKVQSDFKVADQPIAQNNEKVEAALKGAIGIFGGVQLAFSDNPKENELLNISVEDPLELQAIQKEILSPDEAYNEFISQFDFNTPQGWEDLVRETYERRNHKMIRQQAYEQGLKMGRFQMVQQSRNASNPADIANTTPAAPAKKTLLETWADAQAK